MTQLAAFDSPVVTFLDQEIRELKNYPMVCQSLQSVARLPEVRLERRPSRYRELFRERLFDFWGKLDAATTRRRSPWYTGRARFSSQIPLEYAYAAWGELRDRPRRRRARGRPSLTYRDAATPDAPARGFQRAPPGGDGAHRARLRGQPADREDAVRPARPGHFSDTGATLAQALDEFVTIERHVELAAWKAARLAPPERRVLSGETLLVRYVEADQDAGRRRAATRRTAAAPRSGGGVPRRLPGRATRSAPVSHQRAESRAAWSQDGLRLPSAARQRRRSTAAWTRSLALTHAARRATAW